VKSGHIEKSLLVTLTLACVSSCSWFSSNEDTNTDISIDAAEQVKHYCYGTKDKRWECEEQPTPTKINTEFNEPETRKPSAATSTPVETKEPSADATEPASNKKEPSADATEPASNKKQESSPESTPPDGNIEPSHKVLSAPSSAYTVQLIAMKNLKPVLSYAKQVGIDEPLLATVLDKGQVWHLLLLGIYDNPQSANASKDLWIGTRVLKVEPWIRKLAPLQEAIKRYMRER
jgi:septal ring-binding cell division protein DamX